MTWVFLNFSTLLTKGARSGTVGWGTAGQAGRSWVQFPMVTLEFFIDIIFPAALWPWGQLSLQEKWIPGIFPGGKGSWCKGMTILPPSCANCLETWEPQPPETLRACPGLYRDCFTFTLLMKNMSILDFKLSPCSKCCMLSSGLFPGVWILCADVSEHSVCSIFIFTQPPAYEDGTDIVFRNVSTQNSDAGE